MKKSLFLLILFIFFLSGCSSSNFDTTQSYKSNIWSLMLYSTKSPNTDYLIRRIDGYSDSESCIAAGINATSQGGSYECGSYCQAYPSQMVNDIRCKQICTYSGCR